jgi:hypothetical protein
MFVTSGQFSMLIVEGQTQLGMPRGNKISLALNEPICNALYLDLQACTTNLQTHGKFSQVVSSILYSHVMLTFKFIKSFDLVKPSS